MTWYKPWTWRADPSWSLLSGLPTVQFRAVVLSCLDVVTCALVWHICERILHSATMATRADPLILEILLAWFAALCSLHGIVYAGYRTKRVTSADGNLEEDRGAQVPGVPERAVMVPDKITTATALVPAAPAPAPDDPSAPVDTMDDALARARAKGMAGAALATGADL